MRRLIASLAGLYLVVAAPVQAASLPATAANFSGVLARAKAGDTILLAPGVYPTVSIEGRRFLPPLVIASAGTARSATLTDVTLTGVQGLTFRKVEIVTTGRGWAALSQKSKDLTFDRVFVHGSLDGDAGNDGGGLGFLNTSDITVNNSEFTQLRQAIGIGADKVRTANGLIDGAADNVTIKGNDAHGLMKSGFVLAGASHVVISCNTIRDIRVVPPQHPDAIQFFTTGTSSPAHDITISNNIILRGDGQATQGIFLRDQVGSLPYERVVIANNLIVGTGYGGIYVMGAKDLEVSGNELVSNPGKENATWILIQGADGVRSVDNKAARIGYDGVKNLTERSNAIVRPVDDAGVASHKRWQAARGSACAPTSGL